ncbi:hypothetical protein GOB93_16925 [Acetobacter musti]|uniref:Uncharacterized protein n=1 Tax=Acetobacter musti TaxID=864732 RepID=A0ABX0JU12_9PROT|nr:hypothetical protein [Acetobacter musti]NHN86307.1 hypothetical protein [Acetobacter musti]
MKRRFYLHCLVPGLFLLAGVADGTAPGYAQTVIDGSGRGKAAQAATQAVAKHFQAPQDVRFRKIRSVGKNTVCGDVKGDGSAGFSEFGVSADENPVIFDNRPIPAALDFKEVNGWLNQSVALEDLEEMGCVPKGSYARYRDHLNKVMETRKDTTTTH